MGELFLGIDVGTTGSKALLIERDGTVRAESTHEHPLSTPQPLWSEQDPADWWRTTRAAIASVLESAGAAGDAVAAVGLTGQMHGAVLLDDAGAVLRPAILWNDQRTQEQCDEITRRVGPERVIQLTGNPVLPGFTAPKVLWVEQHEPRIHERIAALLLPKDYVRYRLTGERWCDVSDASGTSLFDVAGRRWSDEMVAAVGLKPEWLPQVAESPEACASISAEGAAATGLAPGTPVVAGGGDQAAQAVGCGLVREGSVSATLGTSGVIFASSNSYRVEPEGKLHAFCHAVPGRWHLMGVMLSAGGSLRWYRDTIGGDSYDALMEGAAEVAPGCEGLTFLPYLTGERTPHADPYARGVFFGLSLRHGKAHMTRAVVEGVTFGLCDSLELMRELGLQFDEVRASGGGAGSPLWRQILADVFDCPIVMPNVTQGAAYGAAVLATVGAGAYSSVDEACEAVVRLGDPVAPGAARAHYDAPYERYRSLYPTLRHAFRELGTS